MSTVCHYCYGRKDMRMRRYQQDPELEGVCPSKLLGFLFGRVQQLKHFASSVFQGTKNFSYRNDSDREMQVLFPPSHRLHL